MTTQSNAAAPAEPFESAYDVIGLRIETEIVAKMLEELTSDIIAAKKDPLYLACLDGEDVFHMAGLVRDKARDLEKQYVAWESAQLAQKKCQISQPA